MRVHHLPPSEHADAAKIGKLPDKRKAAVARQAARQIRLLASQVREARRQPGSRCRPALEPTSRVMSYLTGSPRRSKKARFRLCAISKRRS